MKENYHFHKDCKLDNNNDNHFKEAYNTGIDVACEVIKRYITHRNNLWEE